MHHLRFRQIHLDFHTSPAIEGIGSKWVKDEWQKTLQDAAVNSITCFSKCHHGWTYHPTKVGKMHPHLDYDLLRAQVDACTEIDVKVPIYLSAGVDNVISQEHPEWRELSHEGKYQGWAGAILQPGFHKMCFNSPYIDYLCAQIREAVALFPEANGVFLDIIFQGQCCCTSCLAIMKKEGLDPAKEEDRIACSRIGLERYYRETTAACKVGNDAMPVFHNSGHITRGNYDVLQYDSHLELESLPTGGWGYDHFPLSAKYCAKLPLDMLGMTGKFHTTWGEFGGYKHPNALRYECAAMIAFGAKCSVGDQLHPQGQIDETTYAVIGEAYREVAAKEAWCDNVTSVADIAILSGQAIGGGHREHDGDTGATRVLLEEHYLFDVIDGKMDFSPYALLILPDDVKVNGELKAKLDAYVAGGGKLLLTGTSGFDPETGNFVFDIGANFDGVSPFGPDYVLPSAGLRAPLVSSPLVMYVPSQRLTVTDGESLGEIYDPYFNRAWDHFCSHQHTPYTTEPSSYAMGARKGNITYLAHPVFTNYRGLGAVPYRQILGKVIDQILGSQKRLSTNLPSTARVSLMDQAGESRQVLHLLYANTINRGGPMSLSGGTVESNRRSVEVIEELLPLHNVEVALKAGKVSNITLEPQGQALDFEVVDGEIRFTIDRFTCHQMVVLHA